MQWWGWGEGLVASQSESRESPGRVEQSEVSTVAAWSGTVWQLNRSNQKLRDSDTVSVATLTMALWHTHTHHVSAICQTICQHEPNTRAKHRHGPSGDSQTNSSALLWSWRFPSDNRPFFAPSGIIPGMESGSIHISVFTISQFEGVACDALETERRAVKRDSNCDLTAVVICGASTGLWSEIETDTGWCYQCHCTACADHYDIMFILTGLGGWDQR